MKFFRTSSRSGYHQQESDQVVSLIQVKVTPCSSKSLQIHITIAS